jgi:hypothetical protein
MFGLVELDNITYIEYPDCYDYDSSFQDDILGMQISRLNFLEFNDDYLPGSTNPSKKNVWKQTKTPAEVLESICRTMGWCCHFEDGNICFSAVDVANETNGTIEVPICYYELSQQRYTQNDRFEHTIYNSDICRADNESVSAPAYGEIIITADPNEEDVALSLPSAEELLNKVDFFVETGTWQGWEAGFNPGDTPDPELKYGMKFKQFGLVGQQMSGHWIAPGIWSQHFKNGWIATQHDVNEPIGVPSEGNDGEMDSSAQDWYDGQDTDDRYDYDYDWADGWDVEE